MCFFQFEYIYFFNSKNKEFTSFFETAFEFTSTIKKKYRIKVMVGLHQGQFYIAVELS